MKIFKIDQIGYFIVKSNFICHRFTQKLVKVSGSPEKSGWDRAPQKRQAKIPLKDT